MADPYRISSRRSISLTRLSPDAPKGTNREAIKVLADRYEKELGELDDLLYAARQHSLLVVLQGRDTAGKDGTIRKILDNTNALGVRVESFKVPTELDLSHDFLWRVHAKVPARGEIVLFNRSHYEDVLVTRVHGLVSEPEIKARYDAINDFERLLAGSGTIVMKFFLHISLDEQEARLLEREKEPEKAWKLAVGDWKERSHWDEYTEAYELALSRCASSGAPWQIVAANQKWYRNYVVLKSVVEQLRPYRKRWLESLDALGRSRNAEILAYRNESQRKRSRR